MPDPFLLAIGLTGLVALAAVLFAPHASVPEMVNAWYSGLFGIFGFAFQMIMILVSGHALASARPVKRGLEALVSIAKTDNQGMVLTFFVSAIAAWINWGFGLVVAALVARAVARRIRVDYGWLVASAYSGWMIWSVGPSGSIPLTQASHGNALNLVEKFTGKTLGFGETLFTAFTMAPTLAVLLILPLLFVWVKPKAEVAVPFSPPPEPASQEVGATRQTLAGRIDRSPLGSLFLVAAGVAYFAFALQSGTLQVDVNIVIFAFIIAGLALHGSPISYANAIKTAAGHAGAMMLQYPLYGGIMGLMTGTGLAQAMSLAIAGASTAHTLPLYSFLGSLLITLVIPSGGGHWAVQGPFTIPAAIHLHAPIAATAMAVAFGEQVANMLQPFWVVPMVAIAGIGIHRVMGFTVMAFVVGTLAYGASLIFLA
jgi:short-chain fatty acids transporter